MAAVFETFTGELRALVVATWPDVTADGVWENEDEELVPWERLTPPVANMIIPSMPISPDWGVANEVHAGTITLTWVGATTGDDSNQRAKAEAMRDALLTATFTNAAVLDVVAVEWDDQVSVNRTFLEKGYMWRAAQVSAAVLVTAKVAT